MKNKFIKYLSVSLIFASLCFIGCDDTDEFKNDSTLIVTAPAVTLNYTHGSVTNLIETNMKYPFSISIGQPVAFDVVLKVDVVGGTATRGDDFEIPNEIAIKAGSTTASGFIEIFEDDLIEEDETVTLSIGGRTINGSSNAIEVTFNIANLTSDDLGIDLSWSLAETTTDNSGDVISPTAFADLRLLISSTPDNTGDIGEADGGSFESFILESSTPDGEYYVVADFYDVNDEIIRDINLSVNFSKLGVFNGPSYDFSAALNSGNSCSTVYFVLAKIEKVGNSYTMTEIGEKSEVIAAPFIGSATIVADEWEDFYPGDVTTITAGIDKYTFLIDVPDYISWVTNNANTFFEVTIDPATGNVTVLGTEDWNYGGYTGAISGSGSVNACTGEISVVIDYLLDPYGLYGGYALVLQSDNF